MNRSPAVLPDRPVLLLILLLAAAYFGLFARLDQTSEGTGIGLSLVRRIVEMSGGSVWVESAGGGQGCTFYFTLPVAPPAAARPRGPAS